MKIEIGNVNVNNQSLLRTVAAKAGYAASIELVNETTRTIDLGDNSHREAAGITIGAVESMMASLVCAGFSIQRV